MGETRGIDLRHERFCGEALDSAELPQALLDFADFTGARLNQANLASGKLRFAALSGADLESADFLGADLRHARLDHADLRTAKLSDAQLDYVDFAGANLTNADLRGHKLRFVRLTGANLSAANLSGADLCHTSLAGADLRGADLRGAQLDYADLANADLRKADLRGANLRYTRNVERAQIDRSVVDDTTVLPFWFDEPLPTLRRRPRKFVRIRRAAIAGLCVIAAGASVGLGAVILDRVIPGTGGRAAKDIATLPPAASTVRRSADIAAPATMNIRASTTAWVPRPQLLYAPPAADQGHVKWGDLPTLDSAAVRTDVRSVPSRVVPKSGLRLAALVDPGKGRPDVTPVPIAIGVPLMAHAKPAAGARPVLPAVRDWGALPAISIAPDDLAGVKTRLPVFAALNPPANVLAPRSDTGTEVIATLPKVVPLTVIVSLNRQVLDVYRGTELIESTKVSSGKRGHETRTGVYSILQKRRDHRSNLYNGAPMPWMQRLTRTGTALHGGAIPGYPASHGCVRLPHKFAPKLFEMTTVGENVVVAADRVAPKPIEHAMLSGLSAAPAPDRVTLASFDEASAKLKRGAPLRILVTRRTPRDRTIDVQYLLASMGHLRLQNFTGRIGNETIGAIKAFQRAQGLNVTGRFNDALVAQVYAAVDKEEPPEGRLFIRQQFNRVLDAPVTFHDPDRLLGTHLFSVSAEDPNSGAPEWTAITLEGDKPTRVLDRITIPDDVRQLIADFVTPGSSLIVADTSINAAILPEGDDFLVWAKHSPKAAIPKAVAKPKKAAPRRNARKPTTTRRATPSRKRTVKRRSVRPSNMPRGLFSRR